MKTNESNFELNNFKEDIISIEKTESSVWEFSKKDDISNLFICIKDRNEFILDLLDLYIKSHEHLKPIIKEICDKYPGVKSVTFENNFHEISKYLKKLSNLTQNQFNKLNITQNIVNKENRIEILNGNKIFEHQSEFTTLTQNILNLIEEAQDGKEVQIKTERIEDKIYVEEDLISDKEETVDVNIEVEEKEDLIPETKTEENIPTQPPKIKTPFDSLSMMYQNDKKEEEEIKKEKIIVSNEVKTKGVNVENKSFIIDKNKTDDKSIEEKEIDRIILENFSYRDSPTLDEEEKEQIAKKSLKSSSARKYAKVLYDLEKEDKFEIYEMLGRKLFGKTLTLLQDFDIEPLPYSMSQSWVMWDIAKQLYFIKNPIYSSNKYSIEDPLESQEKQDEIVNRHIGWVIYREMLTGKIDNLLAKVQSSTYAKRIIDYMISKPEANKDSLPSYKLADLGKNVVLAFN